MSPSKRRFRPSSCSVSLSIALLASSAWCAPETVKSEAPATTPAVVATAPAKPAAESAALSASQALHRLLEGNERFVAGKAQHPDQSTERRAELAKGQSPLAVILTCADSRVAPELCFDQGLGDLFVIRNAGNVLDDHTLGSIEYAVEHLHTGLIVVVGHAKCGAVSAAVAGGEAPGHLHSLVEAIEPAVEEARKQPGDVVDNAVRANALRVAEILSHVEPVIKPAVQAGRLSIVAARYDLATGRVEVLKPAPKP